MNQKGQLHINYDKTKITLANIFSICLNHTIMSSFRDLRHILLPPVFVIYEDRFLFKINYHIEVTLRSFCGQGELNYVSSFQPKSYFHDTDSTISPILPLRKLEHREMSHLPERSQDSIANNWHS